MDRPSAVVTHLCLHGIGTPPSSVPDDERRYWITRDSFRRVLDLAAAHRDVRLSFDDGNASDIEVGLPELTQRGLTATFFVLAGRLDLPGGLGAADLVALRQAGMGVGSHGMGHRPWRGLDAAAERVEFDEARATIAEAAGAPVTAAACPFGIYDRRALAALTRRGYRVFTSDRAVAHSRRRVQPRFSLWADDDVDSILGILRHRYRYAAQALDEARMFVKRLR